MSSLAPKSVTSRELADQLTIGSLTVSNGVTADVTGNVTGDLTGNVTGDVTGDVVGNVTGNVTGYVTSPMCIVTVSAASVAHNTNTTVVYTSELLDPEGWHSNVTNAARVTPDIAGLYRVTILGDWTSAFTSDDRLVLWPEHSADGTGHQDDRPGSQSSPGHSVIDYMYFNGTTEYVTTMAYQFNAAATTRNLDVKMIVELVRPD